MDKRYTAQAQSFMVQYISLFLILLTFIAGAFCRSGLKEADVPTPTISEPSNIEKSWLQSIHYIDDINKTELETVGVMLLNHDLFAEITLRPSDDTERDLLMSQKVQEVLENQGVPQSTFKIYVQTGSRAWTRHASAQVRWHESS